MSNRIKLILGPTAIGKSEMAMELAQKENGIIISADAYQVYKGMTIGTAKPSLEDLNKAPHFLIDTLTPDQDYSVAEFITRTQEIIENHPEKTIIICGGTGYYIQSFLNASAFPKNIAKDPKLRAQLEEKIKTLSPQTLWEELHQKDPERAKKISPTDNMRIIRALEIMELSGEKASSFETDPTQHRTDVELLGLTAERNIIYDRINKRVELMIKEGLVDEVETLLSQYPENLPAFKAIGYAEAMAFLKGSISKVEMLECIQTRTRQFAKRQLTWFRRYQYVTWKIIS